MFYILFKTCINKNKLLLIIIIILFNSTNNNNISMDDDDCCGNSPLVDNQQHQKHFPRHSNHGEPAASASSKLIELLLCLPALRQADQLIRLYWTRVHRENQLQLANTSQAQPQDTVVVDAAGGFAGQSTAVDRSASIENSGIGTPVVKMNKLFVEMLEACLR